MNARSGTSPASPPLTFALAIFLVLASLRLAAGPVLSEAVAQATAGQSKDDDYKLEGEKKVAEEGIGIGDVAAFVALRRSVVKTVLPASLFARSPGAGPRPGRGGRFASGLGRRGRAHPEAPHQAHRGTGSPRLRRDGPYPVLPSSTWSNGFLPKYSPPCLPLSRA